MKRRNVIVGLIGIFLVLILGGVLMFHSQKIESGPKYKREQDRIVEYLSSHYKDVKKIEFSRIEKNVMTGYWNADVTVNSIYYISVSTVDFSADNIEVTDHITKSNGNELETNKSKVTEGQMPKISVTYFEERD